MENGNKFETETCSRCGGCGKYSYCQMYGDRCFKCGGAGRMFTKRGQAAWNFYQDSLSKTTLELVPGDKIKNDGLFGGPKWMAVKEVFESCEERHSSCAIRNGERVYSGYDIVTEFTRFDGVKADQKFRVAHNAEQKAEKWAAAIAYQDTLTKTGTPRKASSQGVTK